MRDGVRSQQRGSIRWLLYAGVLSAGAFVACESPFEPRGEGERVPVGRVIEQEVTGDSVKWYSFAASPNELFVVFLEALQSNVWLAVFDSTHQRLVATINAGPGGPALDENPSNTFGTPTGGIYRVRVSTAPGASARFRFKVYAIDRGPELVPASFAFGDTVIGETIDPMVDLDEFLVHGAAGQEIVAVGETPGPAGSGSVALTVIDPVANDLLGYVFADAGTSNPRTTGRMRLSGTHDYRVTFGSVTSNTYPRYRGPYRFWMYVINRAPEHRGAPIAFDTEIAEETIDREGDIDEFTFQANTGDEFNVFVQAPRAFQLEVARPGTGPFALAAAVPTDTAFFRRATGRFSAFQTGTYVVRILGSGSHQVADTGRYRLYVYAIDRRPEHVAAAVAVGDTVSGEQIELPGDIDEFSFSASAGEEVNAFFQAEDGTQETFLQLDVIEPAGGVLRSVQSVGTDTSLIQRATGTFVLPTTGTYRIRVKNASDFMDQSRGAYRFFLYRINRAPESVPATLGLGDSLMGEAIDLPGDIDEFTFTAAETALAGFVLARTTAGLGPCLHVALVADAGHQVLNQSVPEYCGTTVEVTLGTGPFAIPQGSHTLRVLGTASTGTGYTGPYRLVTFPLDSLPENVGDSVAIGDTVSGEDLGLPGDYDVFHFTGREGQHIDVRLQGLAPPPDSAGRWIVASVSGSTPPGYLASTSTPLSSTTLDAHRTGRVDLPSTGVYRVGVYPGHGGRLLDEGGAYRFTVVTVPAGPETAPAAMTPGDSVTTERIDHAEDVDEFVLTGLPDQELAVFLHAGETQGLTVVAYDTATGDILDATPSFVARESTGRFRLPGTGVAGIRVYSPRPCPPEVGAEFGGCGTAQALGSYFLLAFPINRAPESVSSAVVVGDTVDGEAIDPRGDVDEFTVTAAQGQTLIAYLQTPLGAASFEGIVLRVVDATSGAVLGSVTSDNPTPNLEDQSTGPIVLPYTGAYTIRVEGGSDRTVAGSYRFKVVLQ